MSFRIKALAVLLVILGLLVLLTRDEQPLPQPADPASQTPSVPADSQFNLK